MKHNGIIILLVILVLAIIVAIILTLSFLNHNAEKNSDQIFEAYGTIKYADNDNITIVSDKKINGKNEFKYSSTEFSKDDRVLFSYSLSDEEIHIKNVELVDQWFNEIDWTDVSQIVDNEQLTEYGKLITIKDSDENREVLFKQILPVRLAGVNIKTLTPEQFLDNYISKYDSALVTTEKNHVINIDFKNSIQLINIKHYNSTVNDINYSKNDQGISFNAKGDGYYVAELELSNEDIIKIIFM